MEKEEVVLRDGTKFKFLKKNWDALSARQKVTIVEYDAINKSKGWIITTMRVLESKKISI